MMKLPSFILVFFVFALTGCGNKPKSSVEKQSVKDHTIPALTDLSASKDVNKILCQNWENKEDAEAAVLSGGGSLEMPFRGFSFFEDGTLVQNPRDKIRFGKYILDDADKVIRIEYNNGSKERYKIVAIGARQMILMDPLDKQRTEYRADAMVQKNPVDDPFHPTNNQWRIKPRIAETSGDIKERTAQCVLFYAKFLEDNAGRGGNTISFVGLPTCFKWYRGGVSVVSEKNLDNNWLNCFYNKQQALKGHAILEKMISKKYRWNKEENNWVKQSADVVKQMYDSLKLL